MIAPGERPPHPPTHPYTVMRARPSCACQLCPGTRRSRSRCAWCRKVTVELGRVAHVASGRIPLDRAVGHQAVPLKIADLCPGRPVPGELSRLRNRRVPRRRAANDRGGALTARTARAECVGSGVLPLRLTGRHARPGLWTNDERDRVLAVPGRRVGGGNWGKRQGDRSRRQQRYQITLSDLHGCPHFVKLAHARCAGWTLTGFRFRRDLGLLGVASLSPVAERGLGSFTPPGRRRHIRRV